MNIIRPCDPDFVSFAHSTQNVSRVQGSSPQTQDLQPPVPTERPSGIINPFATDQELRDEGYTSQEIRNLKQIGRVQCETCSNRTYQDQSDDSGVSFQVPTRLTPGQAATAVHAHEMEHVVRERAEAERENRVAYSTVRIFTSVCSECNRSYVSGGETRTVSRERAERQDFADRQEEENITRGVGLNFDESIG